MMVLADTCVWVLGFAGREPYKSVLDHLADREKVAGHDLVYGELLIGDNGGRRRLLADYRRIVHAPMVAHQEVVMLVELQKLHARGLSWIDAHLLASALVSHMKLWTADDILAATAKDLGVAYAA